jgi:adenine-specific DNA-methyltransferase
MSSRHSWQRELDTWRLELGLMPVPLFPERQQPDAFVLLNGIRGNLCLDLERAELSSETRNYAWSSNVGHYIAVSDRHVEVQRWDKPRAALERYNRESVYQNLEQFHAFLEKNAPRQELSIISHAIRVFRSLRALLGSDFDGSQSLNAFLYLLASVTEGVGRGQLNLSNWRLNEEAQAIANHFRPGDWNSLSEEFTRGRPIESLAPVFNLLLRHASGQLFQEAHYEALFVPGQQLLIEGFLPDPVIVRPERKAVGVHFTPQALARTLVEESLSVLGGQNSSLTIFDPACGSGEFLREIIRQLVLQNYTGQIKVIGWDVSKAACDIANFVLAWEMRNTGPTVDVEIRCLDALDSDQTWPVNVDLILMNPPFVSQQEMSPAQKEAVRHALGGMRTGRVDFSFAFLWKAALSVREGGVIGSILPASFLDSESAKPIRGQLADFMAPRLIARLGSPLLFSNVQIDAALYIAQRGADVQQPAIAFWADHRSESSFAGLRTLRKLRHYESLAAYPVIRNGFSIYPNPDIGHSSKSWAPRPYTSWQLLQKMGHLPKVKTLFDVRQGVLTGANKVFLLDKSKWLQLPDNERGYFRPAVVNRSINYGYLQDWVYVFYPYGEQKLENEEQLQTKLNDYYSSYLLPAKQKLHSRNRVNPEKWWELTWHRNWQVDNEPKLVSTYFGDAGSFAWDAGGEFAVVQGYAWLPKKRLSKFSPLPANLGLAYLALLNSAIFSELLSATSNHVGGGQWNLSTRFVAEIAIPNLFDEQINPVIVNDLAQIGENFHAGLPVDELLHDKLVRIAYGVDEQ